MVVFALTLSPSFGIGSIRDLNIFVDKIMSCDRHYGHCIQELLYDKITIIFILAYIFNEHLLVTFADVIIICKFSLY